ncbi:hypothetical protein U5N28_17030 [Lysinibacillus telephonicus]|uniref:oxidoreductase n=1 Tax=Lysinibacillus telephonicus TaxID=1714840 RepID=UPI00163AF0CF|nr:hypothetical protein [Lysinibacillus telephonicus]
MISKVDNDPRNISYKLRDITIPTRFFLAPINTGFSFNGEPQSELITFHNERSGKGIGISYVGNVSIEPQYVTNKNTSYFTESTSKWKELTSVISEAGSIPGIQIACRNSSIVPVKRMLNTKKEIYIQTVQEELKQLPKAELERIVSLFVHNAQFAYEVGFRVIQIHAAHGYFLSQMLNKELNVRDDEFGTNKLKMISMIINGIREILPSDLILDVRISLIDGLISEESELAYKNLLINQLVELDIDMISFSNGIYDVNKQLIYPLKNWGHGVFIKKIAPFAERYPHIIWNASGNIWDIDELDLEKQPQNLSFSIGRALIADPSFITKSLSGHKLSINHCERKNQCHYYSLGKENITCPIYEASRN